jgi:hypothetical protein|tara:strand:+ start:202 stop:621 length:420 start_codon:yes stop_codon:yes gene_type:complete
MANRNRDITIDQGADYSQTFVLYDSPAATTKMTINNPTQWVANAQMRKSPSHTKSALTFVTDMTDAGASSKITITANGTITKSVKAGRYLYEIVLTNNSVDFGPKTRVQEGIATVTPSVEVGSMYTINSTGYDDSTNYS